MERWSGKVALVTGASCGIGADIAKTLVKNGMKVVGCARNEDAIQKISKELMGQPGILKAIKCDLTKEEEILKMFQRIRSDPDLGGIDVCVNNAGLAHTAPILSGETKHWKEMLDVNVMALSICSREAFKSMQERGVKEGHIILINSLTGHRVFPVMDFHFYAATKYAVTAILQGIRFELRDLKSPVRVTAISPGFVETEFLSRMHNSEKVAKEKFGQTPFIQADNVTEAVIYALSAPSHVEIHDILLRATQQQF